MAAVQCSVPDVTPDGAVSVSATGSRPCTTLKGGTSTDAISLAAGTT